MKRKPEPTQLTKPERIALAGYYTITEILGESLPFSQVYRAIHPESITQAPRTVESRATELKNGQPTQVFFEQLRQATESHAREIVTDYQKRKAREQAKEDGKTDFTNREEFIQYLNTAANNLTNEKDRRDTLKLIADLLRLKEDTPDKSGEIMKFYTPQTCSNCQIKAQFAKIRAEKGGK